MSLLCREVVLFMCILGIYSKDCYNTDPSPFRQYSTKTSYDDVRGKDVTNETIPGCKPIALHMLCRHASRYPFSEQITNMNTVLTQLKADVVANQENSNLCNADVDAISRWKSRMTEADSMRLSDTGRLEAFNTARRFQQRFPGILGQPYDKTKFKFKHTDTERNRGTAQMFAVGLFNSSEGVVFDVANSTDKLLRYYANCKKYDETVKKKVNEEYNAFTYGPEMNSSVADIAARLGLKEKTFSLDSVNSLYEGCRFEHMIYRDAPWCAAFRAENLKHIEYQQDLKYWFTGSYPHNISFEMACPLVEDLVQTFDNAKQGSDVTGVFRFGHAPNMNTYVTRLGLFKDNKPLRADNYQEMAKRKWKTGKISPMTANVAFALYSCDDGQHRVKGFVNESPVVLPGCTDVVCLYETLRSVWEPIASSCDLDQICRHDIR